MIYELGFFCDDEEDIALQGNVAAFRSTPGGKRIDKGLVVTQLAPKWKRLTVTGKLPSGFDFTMINCLDPIFSSRAALALEDQLRSNGELLPVSCGTEELWYFNTLRVADILDRDKSGITWLKHGITAIEIDPYVFHESLVSDLSIFRIPEQPARVFITHKFLNYSIENRITGIEARLLWPTNGSGSKVKIRVDGRR